MQEVTFATIGTSAITERFVDAVRTLEGVRYVGAYSRDIERAREFGEQRGATLFFNDFFELAANKNIDAVYIASPNGLHAEQARFLAQSGKHVLVEKAFAATEKDAQSVFDVARTSGVVALEAMRNLYTEGFANIERTLPELGSLTQATFRFGKVTSRIKRLHAGERVNVFDPTLCEGGLMDIGVYSVEPAVALFGRPQEIFAAGVTTEVGWGAPAAYRTVDLSGGILLRYENLVVDVNYSKVADDMLESQIAGDAGTLHWDNPSAPHDIILNRHKDLGMIYGTIAGDAECIKAHDPENDMQCEIAVFANAVRGLPEAQALVAKRQQTTLDALYVMEAARKQIGVRFPIDDAQ